MTDNLLRCGDCIDFFKKLSDNSIDLILTDIPYDIVNRESNGLRNLDKGKADVLTFNLSTFVSECYRVAKTTIIFCSTEQISAIHGQFAEYQRANKGTVRQLIWEKTNPSPMNGQHIYLRGIENAVWFKKRGGTFNAHCKNTVFKYPIGRSKVHPTEKNHNLLKELILDNSNEGDIICDPCMGSGSTGICAIELGRLFYGCELDEEWFNIAKERINNTKLMEEDII